MADQTRQRTTTSSINISEDDLQNSLKDFLENDQEKKSSDKSIWNIRTVAGLAFIFLGLGYIGHLIATEIVGLGGVPILDTMIGLAPYLGGALVAVTCLGMLNRSKRKNREIEKEERKNQAAYDKLDKFLYSDQSRGSSKKKSRTKRKTGGSFSQSFRKSNTLSRSRTDKKIFGVCGGLAKHLGISSTVLRIIFIAAFFLGYGSFLLVYIAMAVVMPKEPIELMDDFN